MEGAIRLVCAVSVCHRINDPNFFLENRMEWLMRSVMQIGEGGKETAAWAHAAGMDNFDTFRMRCWSELTQHHDFQWPDGVDEVDLGFGGAKFKRPDPNKLLGLGW